MAESTLSATEQQLVLEMHNQFRAEVGAPRLTWDDELARKAQDRADHVGRTGDNTHVGSGENISYGPSVRWVIMVMYRERENYHGEPIGTEKEMVGHYTQMVWPSTTKVGVGGYRLADGGTAFVFLYDPAGNFIGQSAPNSYQAKAGPAGVAATLFDDTAVAKDLESDQKLMPISKLVLRWGDVVDCIHAVHGDKSLDEHGGPGIPAGTGTISEVPISPADPIVEVSGLHGKWFGSHYILQLAFTTKSGKTHGPFGTGNFADTKESFRLTIPEWHRIRAVFGSVAPANNNTSKVLSQIGFALAPRTALFPKPTKGISIVEGNNQVVQQADNVSFPHPLQARVLDDNLAPVVGATVTYTAVGTNAIVGPINQTAGKTVQVKTNADGIAAAIAATYVFEPIQVKATVDFGPEPRTVTFSLTAKTQ